MNRFTTLEQSKKLAEVWKDAETEKVYYIRTEKVKVGKVVGRTTLELCLCEEGNSCVYTRSKSDVFPIFDLSDILERLPAEVGDSYNHLKMEKWEKEETNGWWVISYADMHDNDLKLFEDASLLTALYDLTIWLHENKYIGEGQNG